MSTLNELGIAPKNLPCDVSIHWNSTFDMLECMLKYQEEIDVITDKHKLGLSNYICIEWTWMGVAGAVVWCPQGMYVVGFEHADNMLTTHVV